MLSVLSYTMEYRIFILVPSYDYYNKIKLLVIIIILLVFIVTVL